ncbi:DUF5667 domain-containing protein [Patescibacteria group bacterium]|nr:DUF5667 domain-containing protein [Patescibacteria group bacterium]
MKKFCIYFLLLLIFLGSVTSSFAHKRGVLGIQDQNIGIAPTIEGPGMVLPDSPFYFLDHVKQSVRLAFSFTPEDKAKVYSSIAGERMAELRFMLVKKNQSAAQSNLQGISDNFKNAADQIELAKMSGRDTSHLAKEINDNIKAKQAVLDELHAESQGEISDIVEATATGLSFAKAKVEESLNEADLQNEIKSDLLRQAELNIQDASESAGDLKEDLEDLQQEASLSAKQSLKNREEALKEAIKNKNAQLKKAEEIKLEVERKDTESKIKLQESALEDAKTIVEKAQATARKFEELKSQDSEK